MFNKRFHFYWQIPQFLPRIRYRGNCGALHKHYLHAYFTECLQANLVREGAQVQGAWRAAEMKTNKSAELSTVIVIAHLKLL